MRQDQIGFPIYDYNFKIVRKSILIYCWKASPFMQKGTDKECRNLRNASKIFKRDISKEKAESNVCN